MNWVLIVAVWAGTIGTKAVSIHSIEGFSSLETCQSAAQSLKKQEQTIYGYCIEKK